MGYHPETLAFSFPPYPRGGTSLRQKDGSRREKRSLGTLLYRLKPWIGFDIWHIDPERPGSGNRRDDSCGWFDRTPGEYTDALAYVLRDTTTLHDAKLTLARRKHMPMAFHEGISEPSEDADRARGYPRLTQADCLALVLMFARELETRRWWNGQDGKGGAHASRWLRTFTHKRDVDGIAFDLALSPLDNLSSVETAESMAHLIAAALNRRFRRWWKHPRWHVQHWQINFDLARNLKRMVQPCSTCGKRLGFGYWPHNPGDGSLHHSECLGIRMAEAA